MEYVTVVRGTDQKRIWRWSQTPTPAIAANSYGGQQDHQNHFHIYLRPPTLTSIGGGANLLANAPSATTTGVPNMLMSDFDMPQILDQESVLISQAPKGYTFSKVDTTIWGVQIVEQEGGINGNYPEKLQREAGQGRLFSTGSAALSTLRASEWLQKNGVTNPEPKVTVKLEHAPKHGKVEVVDQVEHKDLYRYTPKAGYYGKDFMSFIVDIEGKKVRLMIPIHVVENIEEPKAQIDYSVGKYSTLPNDLIQWIRGAELSALIANASHSLSGFTDLAGTAVAETTGQGAAATITLDTTAAGHNWYTDPTPLTNTDDYLPTSNPNLWQAKAGTEAAGKMDMLSVLLHEYGHALGLSHSADRNVSMTLRHLSS